MAQQKKTRLGMSETGQKRNTTSYFKLANQVSTSLRSDPWRSRSAVKTTLQLVALAIDRGEIIVSEFAPLLLTLPFTSFQFPSTRFQSMGIKLC